MSKWFLMVDRATGERHTVWYNGEREAAPVYIGLGYNLVIRPGEWGVLPVEEARPEVRYARAASVPPAAFRERFRMPDGKLCIAVDWDGTYGRAPQDFERLAHVLLGQGHMVFILTGRGDTESGMLGIREVKAAVGHFLPIVAAGARWKREAAHAAGFSPDVYIDDSPEYVAEQHLLYAALRTAGLERLGRALYALLGEPRADGGTVVDESALAELAAVWHGYGHPDTGGAFRERLREAFDGAAAALPHLFPQEPRTLKLPYAPMPFVPREEGEPTGTAEARNPTGVVELAVEDRMKALTAPLVPADSPLDGLPISEAVHRLRDGLPTAIPISSEDVPADVPVTAEEAYPGPDESFPEDDGAPD